MNAGTARMGERGHGRRRATGRWRQAAAALLALAVAACLGGPPAPLAQHAGPGEHTLWVVSNGWHTGIVLPSDVAVADGRIPEAARLAPSAFLEFGWGDRDFYPEPDPGKLAALRAGLTPTDAVIRIIARTAPPGAAGDTRAIAVSAATRDAIARAIDRAFQRPAAGPALPLAAGASETSLFFPAHGTFSILNTCNTWIARVLAEAGVPIDPAGVITAASLMGALDAVRGVTRPEPAPS